MNKKYQLVAVLTLLLGLMGCSEQDYPDDRSFRPWRIGAAISYNYPAGINQAYGVNYKEDWTSVMLPYGPLGGSRYDMEKYRRYISPDYDGYALPLGVPVNYTPFQLGSGIKSLPDELYIYWGSHGYRYATVVEVTAQIKAAMVKPYPHPKNETRNCYQTKFLFGFLPDGRAKLWLDGCLFLTYVGEYKPTKAVPVPPPEPKEKPKELTPEQIDKYGHLLFDIEISKKPEPPEAYPRPSRDDPIPWDKVNQVWVDPDRTVQTLDDVIPPTSLTNK
ncbi:hypothetical protein BCT63_06550 [Vibrio kanaloae]|nr:hypothetical protein BCT63_06550 [Vibrio kanaloae]